MNTQVIMRGRRGFRTGRRSQFQGKTGIQHMTAIIGQAPAVNASTTHIIANAGAYATTGVGSTVARSSLSNREQENQIGSLIGKATIDIGFREVTASGIAEIVVWKRERQPSVPVPGTGLPADATMTSLGTQSAFRSEMPGRVLHFSLVALTAETTRTKKIIMNWNKFKLAKIRQGDFYGITIFNRSATGLAFDMQTRYKEYI